VIAGHSLTIDVVPVALEVSVYTTTVLVGTGAIVNVVPAGVVAIPSPPWFHGGATLHIPGNQLAVIPGQVRVLILMKWVPTKISQTGIECDGLSELGIECNKLSETGLGG